MLPLLSTIIVGNIGSLIIWFVAMVIVCAIVYAIMRALEAPAWLYKIALVAGLVLLLLIVIDFLWGGGSGSVSSPVIVR